MIRSGRDTGSSHTDLTTDGSDSVTSKDSGEELRYVDNLVIDISTKT